METRSFLVVDDDPAERSILIDTITFAFPGADVRQVGDPGKVLGFIAEFKFDCILMDYNMPQMDGLSLAQKLRAHSPYVPLVMVTGVGDETLAADAVRSGISEYIPKSRINPESVRRAVSRAIHDNAQAQTIAEQRNELESFAYALAHDFKQPVRQIRTFTRLIENELKPGDDQELQQHLTFLSEAARRLGNLVDVMAQYTLLSKVPQLGEVNLTKVIREVRDALAAFIAERGAELVIGELPIIRGNETLMIQVIQNLVVNGIVYNRSMVPRVEISGEVKDGRCLIAVRDNGIGIESQYLNEIFTPLKRLHPSSEFPGSGLGLTLARKAVVQQGGRIWCKSEVGNGTTFYIDCEYWQAKEELRAAMCDAARASLPAGAMDRCG
jgi:signal transduction histidine kinase